MSMLRQQTRMMMMGSDNDYEGMELDKLMKQHDDVHTRIFNALKETDVNPDDLNELTEMERELTRREE